MDISSTSKEGINWSFELPNISLFSRFSMNFFTLDWIFSSRSDILLRLISYFEVDSGSFYLTLCVISGLYCVGRLSALNFLVASSSLANITFRAGVAPFEARSIYNDDSKEANNYSLSCSEFLALVITSCFSLYLC